MGTLTPVSRSTEARRKSYDVVVVGNGAVGLFLGLELARRRTVVMLAGESKRTYGASAAAGAMLGCFGEVGPRTFQTPWGRARFELDRLAAQRWPDVLSLLGEAVPAGERQDLLTARGTLLIHNTIGHPKIDDDGMAAIEAALLDYKEPYQAVDPSDVEWLDPQPTARPLHALFLPNEHAVHAGAVLNALEYAFIGAGGELVDATVRSVKPAAGGTMSVEFLDGGCVNAQSVVLAAGVRSQAMLDELPDVAAAIPRLVSGPGIAALLREPAQPAELKYVVRTPNRAFACGLHAVPRSDGDVYVGATNAIRPTPTDMPSVRGLQFLLDCAVRQLRRGFWLSDIVTTLVGNRPVTLDGYPLFGPTPAEGLWLLTGTYRDGFHTAPLLATLLADWMETRAAPELIRLFHPIRKPIQAMTRDETIEQTVVHRLATGHEFDWSLPVEWPTVMEGLFGQFYRELAASLDHEYSPPPEILSFIPRFPELREHLMSFYAASRA